MLGFYKSSEREYYGEGVYGPDFKVTGQGVYSHVTHVEVKMDSDLHRRLERHFPDWEERMAYQEKQAEFYKSALRKKKEIIKLRMIEDSSLYSEKELDSINYFKGKGCYARYQDPNAAPNIFDTRQSFLLKMHDTSAREKFLKSFRRINN